MIYIFYSLFLRFSDWDGMGWVELSIVFMYFFDIWILNQFRMTQEENLGSLLENANSDDDLAPYQLSGD